ncbi:RNA ligase family protein [Streptomyces sp. NPDC006631]|uniref:RNA ligase family protein n=1 Tax=Streptomyces sp. NPDC006631 TaxID=3364752 RepID=UPI00367ACFDF
MTTTATEKPTYPKFRPIPRLNRRVVVTEKIHGTNGLIEITKVPDGGLSQAEGPGRLTYSGGGEWFLVKAGSRNRWLTPDDDNYGFAAWAWDAAPALIALGEGKHYGEWFGKGIQHGYGLPEKRFALFNTNRWYDPRDPEVNEQYRATFDKAVAAPPEVTVVPVILVANGRDLNHAVSVALHTLEHGGSFIAPGFNNPEGVVAYHEAAGTYFKATIENDDQPKSKVVGK